MNYFADLQAQFQHFVMGEETGVSDGIVGDELASTEERLAVYFDAYRLRLLGILETEFPGVRALTTAEQFKEIGCGYLDKFPSNFPSVRWFAVNFAEYVDTVQEQFELPYLGEMAAFEWARGRAFDASDSTVTKSDALAKLPADQWPILKITFHASARRVAFGWNTEELWRSINAGQSLPPPARRAEPAQVCVWRRDLTLYWRILDAAEAWAMKNFERGKNFSEVCDGLCEFHAQADVPAAAAGYLSRWIGEGLVADIRL